MAEDIVVKATLEIKEIRRFTCNNRANIQKIKDDISRAFPFLQGQNSNLSLSWTDAEGDRVAITTNTELEDAMKNVTDGVLKLHITLSPEEVRSGPQNVPSEPHSATERSGPTPEVEDYHQSLGSLPEPNYGHDVSNQFPSVDINSILNIGQQPSDASAGEATARQESETHRSQTTSSPVLRMEPFSWPFQECTALNRIKINDSFRDTNSRQPADTYPNGQKNGRLIIINNKSCQVLPPIDGLDHDATCLSDLFKKLKFDVKTLNNPTDEKMLYVINSDIQKGFELAAYGCYIVVVLSYCENNNIYDSQGNTLEVWRLTDRICDSLELKGKPKIFIIEGYNERESYLNMSNPVFDESTQMKIAVDAGSDRGSNPLSRAESGQDQTDASLSSSQDDSDVYILKANTYGKGQPYVKGSVFVQALVDIFVDRAYQDSFQDIISKTIAKLRSSGCRDLELPAITRDNLNKKLYFYP